MVIYDFFSLFNILGNATPVYVWLVNIYYLLRALYYRLFVFYSIGFSCCPYYIVFSMRWCSLSYHSISIISWSLFVIVIVIYYEAFAVYYILVTIEHRLFIVFYFVYLLQDTSSSNLGVNCLFCEEGKATSCLAINFSMCWIMNCLRLVVAIH